MNKRKAAYAIHTAAVEAVNPEFAVRTFLHHNPDILPAHTAVEVVAIGKAAGSMMQALHSYKNISIVRGILATKQHHLYRSTPPKNIIVSESDHPVPGPLSIQSGQRVCTFLESAKTEAIVFLISGGGSAMVTLPFEGITLTDLQETTQRLLSCGATISEINVVRKHLDSIKGGGLLRSVFKDRKIITLVLSDVIGDDLSVIAFGPTYWDNSTFQDAIDVLKKYSISQEIPTAVMRHLLRGTNGHIAETVKQDDPVCKNVQHYVVGNLGIAVDRAKEKAEELGFRTRILTYIQEGEAKEVGIEFANMAMRMSQNAKKTNVPICILMGGETTVTLEEPNTGKGGRNQELILAAGIEARKNGNILFYSFGTDGIDGPTDAAGALTDTEIFLRAKQLNINPLAYLRNHDSYTFFEKTTGLIKTGPSGTNVGDITMALID